MSSEPPSSAQPAPSLLALPPELLQHILASVPLADRLSRVARPCTQLRAACQAPALLSNLDVRITGERCVARTHALLGFLARHSKQAHSLQLDICPEEANEDDDDPEFLTLAAITPACLAVCSGLRQLSISPATPLLSTSCLRTMSALQQLRLAGRSSRLQLRLRGWRRQLTALQDAHLSGRLLCEGGGYALPPSLTRLCIEGDLDAVDGQGNEPRLDSRVLAGLPVLRCLELSQSNYTSASLAAVSGLTALTRLVLSRVDNFPPVEALAALAGTLRTLEVHSVVESAALNSCIQALTRLETLLLDIGLFHESEFHLQPATMRLPRLRRFSITAYDADTGDSISLDPRSTALPPGTDLSSLHTLALPLPLALAAVPLVSAASSLHRLCLVVSHGSFPVGQSQWAAFWRGVTARAPLRRLLYETPARMTACPFELHDALLGLQRQRPELEVRRLTAPINRMSCAPACWAEMAA